MTYVEHKVGEAPEEVIDSAGAVFAPLRLSKDTPRAADRMVYAYGPPKGSHRGKSPMYTCPVSGIPEEVWRLIALWYECKQLGTLPFTGGLLAQPMIVRRAFTVLQEEQDVLDRTMDRHNQASAMVMAFGGSKK